VIIRLCVAALLLMPATVLAQGNPGPFGGLFGRAPARVGEDQTLVEVRSSVGGQYDSAILAPEDAPAADTQSGAGAGGTVGLVIQHQTEKFSALVDGGARRVQYFVDPSYGLSLYSGSASIASVLTSRLEAGVSGSYVHSPFYQIYPSFGMNGTVGNPGTMAPFAPYATQMLENESVQATAGLTARLTERTKLTASAYRRQTMFTESDADFTNNGYQARWTWEVRRDLGVYAGYGHEHAVQSGVGGQEFDNETIDIGIDYRRTFSLSRRTTFGFSTSTSVLKTGTSAREVRVNGGVILTKYFRRTWRAAAHATRATSYVPGFYEPLYSDTVGVSLGGMFSTRLEWVISADAGRGEAAFSNTSGFNTVTASSKLTFALSRYVGLYGQYSAYGYEIPENSNALGLDDRLARQAISVGLTAYIPLYKKVGQ